MLRILLLTLTITYVFAVPIVNDEPESDVEISAEELAKLTGPQAYTCTVDKTKEAAASILQAVEGDAAAAMKSWDTQGDLDGEPIENDDGSLTLKYKCKVCSKKPELTVTIVALPHHETGFSVFKVGGNVECDLENEAGDNNLCSEVKLEGNKLTWRSHADASANFHWALRWAARWLVKESRSGFDKVCAKFQTKASVAAKRGRRRRFRL